jgi:hypothetical protein
LSGPWRIRWIVRSVVLRQAEAWRRENGHRDDEPSGPKNPCFENPRNDHQLASSRVVRDSTPDATKGKSGTKGGQQRDVAKN